MERELVKFGPYIGEEVEKLKVFNPHYYVFYQECLKDKSKIPAFYEHYYW